MLDPYPEDLVIEDIAGSGAKICRFNGHSTVFYSVAQHEVIGSHVVEERTQDLMLALGFLLHDSGESYIGDMCRPLKKMPELQAYRDADDRLNLVIGEKYHVNLEHPIIKKVDEEMLATEREQFMIPVDGWFLKEKPLPIKIKPWSWQRAEREFLLRYRELRLRINGVPKLAAQALKYTSLIDR
jgi:hypothetical protein